MRRERDEPTLEQEEPELYWEDDYPDYYDDPLNDNVPPM